MLRWTGWIALAALALAAWTGVLLRFGIYQGMPDWAQNYTAVRHAHSHLMYFGWVTLGLMALIRHELPRWGGHPLGRAGRVQLAAAAFLALLSFPAFWANGYGLTQVGTRALPLGSMVAGLNVLVWYAFLAQYILATRRLPARPLPVQLWDWALALLVLSTAGLAGLVTLLARGTFHPLLQQLFLHLFLDLFAAGWFALALLGTVWSRLAPEGPLPERLPTGVLALALLPTFMLGMSPGVLTPAMFWVAAGANVLAAVLLGRHWLALYHRRHALPALHRLGLVAFGLHLAIAALLAWPGVWQWSAGTQLRVFFLHNYLLGWVSSVLLALLLQAWQPHALTGWAGRLMSGAWIAGTGVLLVTLAGLGLARLVPVPALLLFQIAAWVSLLPAGAALLALVLYTRRVVQARAAPALARV